MQPVARIPRVAAGVALVVALVILLAVAFVQTVGWYRFVPILSGSMSPYIDTGDLAVLQPVDAAELGVGDVIAFEAPIGDRQLMLHRVSEVVSAAPDLRIRTRGDANSSDDPWTAQVSDDVLWRATGKVPSLGKPVVLAHRVGAASIVSIGGVLVLLVLALRRAWQDELVDPHEDADDAEPLSGLSEDRSDLALGQPVEAVVALTVVAAVVVAGIGLILVRPAGATFTAAADEEQRVTFRSAADPAALSPPSALVAEIICDVLGAPTGVELRWTEPDPPADLIGIERSSTPLLGSPEPFIELARVGPSDVAFTDDFATVDPPPSNPLDVRYRVRSGSADGRFSAYSNIASVELCIPDVLAGSDATAPTTTVLEDADPTLTGPLTVLTEAIG